MWSIARMARYVQRCRYLQQLKDNDEACSQAIPKGSFMLFCKGKPFLACKADGNPFQNIINWRSFEEAESFNPNLRKSSIVLDVEEADLNPLFVCAVSPDVEDDLESKHDGYFVDMRKALFSVSDREHQLLARGYSMVTWNDRVNFCSYCGSPLNRKMSGCSKDCSKKCHLTRMTHYPQIHPVAIIRVVNHLEDRILLVRQPRHPKGMFSCIAGFMEPGETLEDNIRREIAEEVGIVVGKVNYFQSEAWPLPQISLMLGCTTVAMPESINLDIDREELEDGKWFTKEEVREALERVKKNPNLLRENDHGVLIVPPHGSISNLLIKSWVEQYVPSQL